mmetsp:Transcript_4971/g.14253  ORF Transcript_4971/g.14253 Transcript_4971/m.14253 type:complete len:139 (-) Transcript_4971:722-1138(-)
MHFHPQRHASSRPPVQHLAAFPRLLTASPSRKRMPSPNAFDERSEELRGEISTSSRGRGFYQHSTEKNNLQSKKPDRVTATCVRIQTPDCYEPRRDDPSLIPRGRSRTQTEYHPIEKKPPRGPEAKTQPLMGKNAISS